MQPLLLLYNLDGEADGAVKALCAQLGILWRAVSPSDYGRALGALAGLPGDPAPEAPAGAPRMPFTDPMLVMVNLLRPQFDALLQGLRARGVRIPLKAVLTPTSVRWDSWRLHDELAQEHEAMRRRT